MHSFVRMDQDMLIDCCMEVPSFSTVEQLGPLSPFDRADMRGSPGATNSGLILYKQISDNCGRYHVCISTMDLLS